MIVENQNTRFNALISRFFESSRPSLSLFGSTSMIPIARALTLSTEPWVKKRPQLVIFPNEAQVKDFENALRFFSPSRKLFLLEAYDASPYSGLYPNTHLMGRRVGWLWEAINAKPGQIFAASIEALAQKCIPLQTLKQRSRVLRVGMELPDQLTRKMNELGYQSAPRVEDIGQYSNRGGILDIFSPSLSLPVRLELVGDTIESIRTFDPESQRSQETIQEFVLVPAREALLDDIEREKVIQRLRTDADERGVAEELTEPFFHDLALGRFFPQMEFLLPQLYTTLGHPLQFLPPETLVWIPDQDEVQRSYDDWRSQLSSERAKNIKEAISPELKEILLSFDTYLKELERFRHITQSQLNLVLGDDAQNQEDPDRIHYKVNGLVSGVKSSSATHLLADQERFFERIREWRSKHFHVLVSTQTLTQAQRVKSLLERFSFHAEIATEEEARWEGWATAAEEDDQLIHIIPRPLTESLVIPEEKECFLREDDFFGKKARAVSKNQTDQTKMMENLRAFEFGDLQINDHVVHTEHGVCVYEGLKSMQVGGVAAEFIQLRFKDNDRLYLPIYRISQLKQFPGVGVVDKLGGTGWHKTKIKVQSQIRDVASELLKLYARRSQITRPPFSPTDDAFDEFEALFPYEETIDQVKAIDAIIGDMTGPHPMDRLVCGDVGFGKTEVALRAAFKCFSEGRQVALLAPTTVLVFQHLELLKKRFAPWTTEVVGLSRFTSKAEAREGLQKIKTGAARVVVGTHRLLSKDVEFKDLGLLIVDEEQKFGVLHKERIRKLKTDVDTLSLSATPIPRTLNMSLVGIRDLSIINTAPRDRLPIRTYVCRRDLEVIRKAIESEIQRGGQVFYIRNRIQGIEEVTHEIKEMIPDARIRFAHGQMDEDQLETTMLAFYKHEFDVLICTTIIESGLDITNANTMLIERADTFGLSQLYQIRGRVGRGKERAYCYLMIPPTGVLDSVAQERLRLIQEHTTLGSGFKIAHHDLELRGAGNILGESQSGHIESVGYELYLELLEDAVRELKGEEKSLDRIEPDINLRIAALIPDSYIPDIRIRL
ncbi:MAG: transcription-repair coupling factor, partial [Bdellovibrionales bacterium]|nr:transcription-repair coupling factor [Bdellovibrionales bacterium]